MNSVKFQDTKNNIQKTVYSYIGTITIQKEIMKTISFMITPSNNKILRNNLNQGSIH